MKAPKKSFDCVQMKNEIQAKLYARRAGMTEAQRRADIEQQLESSNSPIAKWWRENKPAAAPLSGKATAST